MMYVGSVLFEPNDLLMFRGPMEFTPTIRGPQALARTLPLPLPSTIVGCLATLLLDKEISAIPNTFISWEDALIQVLGLNGEACFRGPYLLVDHEVYVPFEEGLIKLADLSRTFRKLNLEEVVHKASFLREVLEQLMVRLKKVENVGVGLERTTKTVRRGLLYSAEFIDYLSTFSGHKVSIAMDVYGATALNKLSSTERYVIRLGGEGRTVQIKIRETRYLEEGVKKIIKETSSEKKSIIYMVSPALMRTPLTNLAPVVSTKKPRFPVDGIPVELLAGHINILGAGFDLYRKIRKPMYASLTHGSLLLIEIEQADLTKLYQHGLSDVGCKLGYGTFIPFYIK
jgi:CRISPR type III-B/RAMP module-associated protein Cmr3